MPPNGTKRAASSESSSVGKQHREYTWEEVAQHNTEESCWIYVGKKVYDITPWLNKHPGGKEMLMLAAGRDSTDLFTSYHPFTTKPQQVLEKFEIGTIKSPEFIQYPVDTGFYRTLCERVGEYFEKNNKNYKDPTPGFLILGCLSVLAYLSFMVAYNAGYSWPARVLATVVFGVCEALLLMHLVHDTSHTSLGRSSVGWSVIGRFVMDWFAGASLTSWYNQHILGHHVYTNMMGADPDLPSAKTGDIRRVSRGQMWAYVYKFQYIYLLFLYGWFIFKFRIQDITAIFSQKNGTIRVNVKFWSDLSYQIIVKLFWIGWRLILPIYVWNLSGRDVALLFVLGEWVAGLYLAFNFQVSHVSPCTIFPDIKSEKTDEWAVSQVKTTVDYAHGNALTTFLSGALNYQTSHHLFPCVSQYHYAAIAPIIKEVCKQYNVRYNEVPTFTDAMKMHIQHLKDMGIDDLHFH